MMPNVITIENAALERDAHRHEGTLARLGGRLKFTGCPECGSQDGMQAVHRETLAEMPPPTLAWIKHQCLAWYREPGNAENLFYPCPECNHLRTIPDGFVVIYDILVWLSRDPMSPDYAALAAEEPVSQIGDSRDAAGLENTYDSADRPEFWTNEG